MIDYTLFSSLLPTFLSKICNDLRLIQDKVPLAQLCNHYQITQSLFYYWRDEFLAKAPQIFESAKQFKKEQHLQEEIKKLKCIIAELSIELKKTN